MFLTGFWKTEIILRGSDRLVPYGRVLCCDRTLQLHVWKAHNILLTEEKKTLKKHILKSSL